MVKKSVQNKWLKCMLMFCTNKMDSDWAVRDASYSLGWKGFQVYYKIKNKKSRVKTVIVGQIWINFSR